MTENYIELRQRRDFGGILNVVFLFYRQNVGMLIKSLLAICAMPVGAGIILGAAFVVSTSENRYSAANIIYIVGIVLCSLATYVLALAVVHAVVLMYVASEGETVTVREVWECVRERLGRLVLTFIMGFAVFALIEGVLLLLVYAVMKMGAIGYFLMALICLFGGGVGTWLIVPLTLVIMVQFQERLTPVASVKRSFELIKGNWWMTFGLYFILYVIVIIATYALMIPMYMMGFTVSLTGSIAAVIVVMCVMYIALMVLQLLLYIAPALQYYNLAELKEGAGTMDKILGQIGSAGPEPVGDA